jgi:threonine synthase
MEYISTRNKQKTFSFGDVFLNGLAPDGGLYVPTKIPLYSSQDLEKLRNLSYRELANQIILNFCGDEFTKFEIKDLIKKSYKDFNVKEVVALKKIGDINLLELFHGPTFSFKDIAMQVIGNMYENI